MNSYCAVYKLASGMVDRYIELHENCWPRQAAALRKAGAEDMEIFIQGELCIITYKCEDFGDFLEKLAASPVNAEWQKLVDGCFEKKPNLSGEEKIEPAKKVFSLAETLEKAK